MGVVENINVYKKCMCKCDMIAGVGHCFTRLSCDKTDIDNDIIVKMSVFINKK